MNSLRKIQFIGANIERKYNTAGFPPTDHGNDMQENLARFVILGRLRPAYCWLDPGIQYSISVSTKD